MEVDEMDSPKQQASKYTRVSSNGDKMDTSSIGDTSAMLNGVGVGVGGGGGGEMVQSTRFGRQWQHSSRIIRVSRASGGKDRHSKVWTAKGPRDRRVRLSVTTAIQFYDLQDRLGYDQPSKAVEWLIRNASDAINELPSLNACVFPPDTPRQLTDLEMDNNNGNGAGGLDHGQKSGCSSNNSETSKGSGLSLSRTESRVKARERARERTAKDKDKEKEKDVVEHAVVVDQVSNNRVTVASHQSGSGNVRPMETSSFTQLLTAGINTNLSDNRGSSSTPSPHHHGSSAKNNNNLEWLNSSCGTTTAATAHVADYFGNGLMGISSDSRPRNPIQLLGNATVLPHAMSLLPFATSHEMQQHHHNQQQHFPFLLDQHQHHHLVQVPNNTTTTSTTGFGGSEYNLNFSMSPSSTTSGLGAGFNRGTLQSNSSSPSMLSYLQRFSNTDGSSVPFFLGGAPISPVVDNQHHHHNQHHHQQQQFDPAGLQLCYGGGSRHPDQKGKGKN